MLLEKIIEPHVELRRHPQPLPVARVIGIIASMPNCHPRPHS